MKKIMAAVNGDYRSITVRLLTIARALREREDYEIVFSGSGNYMDCVDFPRIETEHLRASELEKKMTIKDALCVYTPENLDSLLESEEKAVEEVKPDVIIRDILRDPLAIVAKRHNIPDISFEKAITTPWYFQKLEANHEFVDLAQPYIKDVSLKVRRKLLNIFFYYFDEQAKEEGFLNNKESFLSLADLTLITDSPSLFSLDIPYNEKPVFLGPILEGFKIKAPDWIESFKRDKRKKILISGGSTGYHEKISFCEFLPEKEYALALRNSRECKRQFSGDFDIRHVLPYCDVFVSHGGTGSTYFALESGVPILVSYNHFEQQANAVQITNRGAGLPLPKEIASVENIKDAIRYLQEDSFKEKSLNLGEKIRAETPIESAIREIKKIA